MDKDILCYDEKLISRIKNGYNWVCFGAGRYFREFIDKFCVQRPVLPLPIGCFDNNSALWGTKVKSVPILPPAEIKTAKFMEVITVVSSVLPYGIISYLNDDVRGGRMCFH